MASGLPENRKSEATPETSLIMASDRFMQPMLSSSVSAAGPKRWARPVRCASAASSAWMAAMCTRSRTKLYEEGCGRKITVARVRSSACTIRRPSDTDDRDVSEVKPFQVGA